MLSQDKARSLFVTTPLKRRGTMQLRDLRVVFPPSGPCRSMVVPRSLAQTPVLLALGSKSTGLSVFVYGVGDPVDSCVSSDGFVVGAGGQRTNAKRITRSVDESAPSELTSRAVPSDMEK